MALAAHAAVDARRKTDEAMPHYLYAVETSRRLLGPTHILTGEATVGLAALHFTAGRKAEALEIGKKGVEIVRLDGADTPLLGASPVRPVVDAYLCVWTCIAVVVRSRSAVKLGPLPASVARGVHGRVQRGARHQAAPAWRPPRHRCPAAPHRARRLHLSKRSACLQRLRWISSPTPHVAMATGLPWWDGAARRVSNRASQARYAEEGFQMIRRCTNQRHTTARACVASTSRCSRV